jgi:hypothetical protein
MFVRKNLKKLLTNFVAVEYFNLGDRTINHIDDQLPSDWFESHGPQTGAIRSLGPRLRIKYGAKIIAAAASI